MDTSLAASGMRLPAELDGQVQAALERAVAQGWVERIWSKDASLWSADARVQGLVSDRLGWLHAPEAFLDHAEELAAFATDVRQRGFERAVLCGMGGSSLAPEVMALTYGVGEDGIPVHVLDSTDPVAVQRALDENDPRTTLYLISSKSGTTTETLSFLALFWQEVAHRRAHGLGPAEHFVAITDPGKSLEAFPHSDEFRSVFLNPPDIGGRYSALTYFGLVPAALLGVDLGAVLANAVMMAQACREDASDNPGLALGVALGTLARAGRDKLTLLIDPAYASFGAWAEQLIAESTGKHGVGVVPIDREPPGDASRYGDDRVFVRLLGPDEPWRAETDRLTAALAAAGHPVVDLEIGEDGGLGGEFLRWEFATAVAGVVLGINPFDEPNVTESKENTKRVLGEYHQSRTLPAMEPLTSEAPLTLYGDQALRLTNGDGTIASELKRHLDRIRPASYLAIQAYVAATPERDAAFAALRALLRDRTGRATTFGYGPRFLHSTGQLHKGGAPIGWFLQLVGGHPEDLQIPGTDHSFGTLIDAQALGDFQALEAHDLPVLRVGLSDDVDAGIAALTSALAAIL